MVKRSKAPSGFYTAQEAMQRLSMKKGTFFYHVKTGKIEKEAHPNKKEGYYSKGLIDRMAKENALFTIVNSIEPVTFHRVENEEDIKGIVDLCIAIYGQGGTPTYDARLEIWQKNPEVYYITRQEGIVTGYISMIWFDEEAIQSLMGQSPKPSHISSAGNGVYSITGPEHVKNFVDGQPIDHLFVSLGVRPGLSNTEQREYGFKLLRGTQEVLAGFASRGMPIGMLYATSERADGKIMAGKMGMTEITYQGDHLVRYELDVEKSNHPLLQPYKDALAQLRQQQSA